MDKEKETMSSEGISLRDGRQKRSVKPPMILVVEDERVAREPIVDCLREMGYQAISCQTGAEVFPLIARNQPAAILLDINLPDMDGVTLLEQIFRAHESIPVIMITGYGTVDNAVHCLQLGAFDFLTKPPDFTRLQTSLRHAVVVHNLIRQKQRSISPESYSFDEMLGISPQMETVFRTISNVAKTDATIFITGESGTGKELVARAIHKNSKRSRGPFIAVNCAAIPRELLESELFGHEKGAFTGAIHRHIGCCEAANGGTLFLDEICDMSTDLQVKLLRFLQDLSFQRVGGTETLTADVRLIAATNKDPIKEVEKGAFREDFYYRLLVIPIEVPPLREREEDIALLATHFVQTFAKRNKKNFKSFSREAMKAILKYPWSGNVRELENTMERLVVLYDGPSVSLAHLPEEIAHYDEQQKSAAAKIQEDLGKEGEILPLDELIKKAIQNALELSRGDISTAAKKLEVPEETVREKIEEYGL